MPYHEGMTYNGDMNDYASQLNSAYGGPSIYQTAGSAGSWSDYLPSADAMIKGGGLGLLGLMGAGIGQNLFGAPRATQTKYQPSAGQANSLAMSQNQLGAGGNLFGLLQGALQRPSIPPELSLLAEQAFQPAMGDIASQAIMSARRRGFSGGANLLQEGPAGAIAGPALADLQPQMAAAKLALYQNWINNLMQAQQIPMGLAQGYRQAATAFQPTQVMQAPKPSILDTMGQIAPILSGIGSIFGSIWK